MRGELHWLSPGDPEQRTGGYLYNARMAAALRELGWRVHVHALPGAWPWPCGADLQAASALIEAIPKGATLIADGLLWPGLGAHRERVTARHQVVVVVHSLLDKEGCADASQLIDNEMRALAQADGWFATSPATARLVAARLGPEQVPGGFVCPGTAPARPAEGSGGRQLLAVATVTPRKGIRDLVASVAALAPLDWRLDIVGSLARDPAYVAMVESDIAAHGLADRVTLCGELVSDALEAAYMRADILVHAAHFEAFGMVLSEAIARGIPVVSTPAGALEVLPCGAVSQVPACQPALLTAELHRLISGPDELRAMADAAARAKLPTWGDAAMELQAALVEIL